MPVTEAAQRTHKSRLEITILDNSSNNNNVTTQQRAVISRLEKWCLIDSMTCCTLTLSLSLSLSLFPSRCWSTLIVSNEAIIMSMPIIIFHHFQIEIFRYELLYNMIVMRTSREGEKGREPCNYHITNERMNPSHIRRLCMHAAAYRTTTTTTTTTTRRMHQLISYLLFALLV